MRREEHAEGFGESIDRNCSRTYEAEDINKEGQRQWRGSTKLNHKEMICESVDVWLLCDYSHTTARRMVPACTKCDVQLMKVAADDGLI